MRKSQPSFVVEYKGSRRQKRSQEKSIWGAVDLASLRAETEDDLPPEMTANLLANVVGGEQDRANLDVPNGHLVNPNLSVESMPSTRPLKPLPEVNHGRRGPASPTQDGQRHHEEATSLRDADQSRDHWANAGPGPKDIAQDTVSASEDSNASDLQAKSLSRKQLADLDVENAKLKKLLKH